MFIVRVLLVIVITFSGFGTYQAASLNNAMQDCAKIKRDLKRLACFDKLSGRVDSFATEALTETQQQAVNKPEVEVDSPVVINRPSRPEDKFGLTEKSDADEIEVITSYIPGKFSGWRKDDEITLANGQVWKITGGSSSVFHKATDPKVEIRRGVFGSFRIKIIGLNRTAQVKRIK